MGSVDTSSPEFKALQQAIAVASKQQSAERIIKTNLLSLRFQMETYLETAQIEKIEIGTFLKKFMDALQIKNKDFAKYIGYKESNLSALFSGKRKINGDLALKLGSIFKIDAALWIHIQTKNELMKIKAANEEKYAKYQLEDLLKKAA